MVGWDYPPMQWVKLHTDGSLRIQSGNAAAGGIIRFDNGNLDSGFTCNIGICTMLVSESRGVIHGLREANQCADFLANLGFSYPPMKMNNLLLQDKLGVSFARTCFM
ncbi:conserved hypothetical protein [Ricinus communis]|uniref:RNase H type-1 domain-containing protein n=1 Tax=Ricinus communis TaxID=3988 RepID=B9RX87_RICCO|nr:conserved hypothetical protein [Ricinus communis]